MGRTARVTDRWTAARLWLLAPLVVAGCASSQANKTGDAFQSLGSASKSEPSWTDKLAAPFKAGDTAAAGKMSNRQATANDRDSLSLSNKPDKKNPDLLVAVAQMHERSGKLDEADKKYQEALKRNPKHLGALVGFAHLQDRRSKFEEATKLYQKAIAAHPTEAAVYNDLGLCYHRRGMLKEAQGTLAKAVELAPDRKLYRNNLATAYVDQGQPEPALAQLIAAHGPAAGHYNLGYLLAKKGDQANALKHFQQAVTYDPSMAAAKQWVAKLAPHNPIADPMVANASAENAVEPRMAQRYPMTNPEPGPTIETRPRANPTSAPVANDWATPPSAVRYPNQQTSTYSDAAAVPPMPDQVR